MTGSQAGPVSNATVTVPMGALADQQLEGTSNLPSCKVLIVISSSSYQRLSRRQQYPSHAAWTGSGNGNRMPAQAASIIIRVMMMSTTSLGHPVALARAVGRVPPGMTLMGGPGFDHYCFK